MADIAGQLRAAGAEHVLPVSGATGAGLNAVLDKILEAVGENSSIERKSEPSGGPDGEDKAKDWSPL